MAVVWTDARLNANGAFVFLQLDPQTLQSKDWQRTVIGLNGVSLPPPSTRLSPTNLRYIPNFRLISAKVSGALRRAACYCELNTSVWFQIDVKLSMKFTSREFSLKRMPSRKQSGVFGVKINVVTK